MRNIPGLLVLLTLIARPQPVAGHGRGASKDELTPIPEIAPDAARVVEFYADIRPILQTSCVACHNRTKAEGDLVLEDPESIRKGGSFGEGLIAGQPEESWIYRLARRGEDPAMPPLPNDRQAPPLTPEQLGLLKKWIADGAPVDASRATRTMNWQPISPELRGVYSLDLDPTGRFIAAGRANTVTIYDLARRDVPQTLADPALSSDPGRGVAHRDFVHAIAFHPAEPVVATSGYRNVKFWRRDMSRAGSEWTLPPDRQQTSVSSDGAAMAVVTPAAINVISAHDGAVRGTVALDGATATISAWMNAGSGWLLAGLNDQRLAVIRAADLQVVARSEPFASAVTAITGELEGGRVAVLLADGTAKFIAVAADNGALTVSGDVTSDAGAITRIAGSGTMLLTVGGARQVQVRNVADGSMTARADLSGDITSISLAPVSDRVAIVLDGARPVLWSVKELKELASLTADREALRTLQVAEFRRSVRDSLAAVIQAQIAEAEKEITTQKEAETKARAEVEKQAPLQAEAKSKQDAAAAKTAAAKTALEAQPESAELKAALEAAMKEESGTTAVLKKTESDLAAATKSVDFAVQGIARAEQRLADHRARHATAAEVAATAAAEVEQRRAPAIAAVSSPFASVTADGQFVVTAGVDGTLRLWSAIDGKPVDVLPPIAGQAAVTGLLVTGSSAAVQLADGRQLLRPLFPAWALEREIGSEDGKSPFTDRVLALAFSPDGQWLAAGGGEPSRSGELTLWNASDGSLVRRFEDAHSDTVFAVEFSADGRWLASSAADKFIKVFDPATGQFVRAFEGHTHHVMDVSWKADGTALASAGADNAIKVWNVDTGEQSRTISTYKRQVTALQFVGLQDLIVSGSGDRRVFFHTPSNGQPAREFGGNTDYVYRVATNAEGSLVVSGGEDGSVRVWNGPDAASIAVFTSPASATASGVP